MQEETTVSSSRDLIQYINTICNYSFYKAKITAQKQI